MYLYITSKIDKCCYKRRSASPTKIFKYIHIHIYTVNRAQQICVAGGILYLYADFGNCLYSHTSARLILVEYLYRRYWMWFDRELLIKKIGNVFVLLYTLFSYI